jgi:hypothetical protein
MTTTSTPAGPARPDLTDLIDAYGAALAHDLRAGLPAPDDETTVDRFLADAKRVDVDVDAVLEELVRASIGAMVAVCCLLDECDEASYATEMAIAATLTAEIRRQANVEAAVRELVLYAVNAAAHAALDRPAGEPATVAEPQADQPAGDFSGVLAGRVDPVVGAALVEYRAAIHEAPVGTPEAQMTRYLAAALGRLSREWGDDPRLAERAAALRASVTT